jgi:hypothetical protein
MVLPKLSEADVKEIQRLLKEGHSNKELAKKYDVSPSVISRRAKTPYLGKFVPLETRNNIIKKIQEGYTKAETAQMYNIPVNTVLGFTKGLRSGKNEGNHFIRSHGIVLLNRLMVDGCLINDFVISTVRGLQQHFPMIMAARYKNKTFFYLKGREEDAIEAYFKDKLERIINYSAIEELSYLLGVKISKDDQRNLIERYKRKHVQYWESRRLIQRRIEDFVPDLEYIPVSSWAEPSFRLFPK